MNTHSASNRRYRPKVVKLDGAQLRFPMGVKFPWETPGVAEKWNVDDYSHRAFMDGQEQFNFAEDNRASTTSIPGEGEPRFVDEPEPSRKTMARCILTTKNSKRDVIEARFPIIHPNNTTGNVDSWWTNHFVDKTPIGREAGEEKGPCPAPLTDDAIWIKRTGNRIEHTGPNTDPLTGYGQYRLPEIAIYTNPSAISNKYIDWKLLRVTGDYRFDIKRRCTRFFCWKNVTYTDGLNLPVFPYAILREIEPNAPFGIQGDIRFQPFGWTDAEKLPAACAGVHFGTTENGGLFFPRSVQQDETKEHVPPPQEIGVNFAPSASFFSSTGIPNKDFLLAMFNHCAQPWSVEANTPGGFAKIQAGRPFDLIVEADIYRYKLYKYDETTGTCLPVGEDDILPPVGPAGSFGRAYAIF